jgi:hypothetical protein
VAADGIERAHPSLLDRLNTLVWLQGRRGAAVDQGYRERIERQASRTLEREPEVNPFPSASRWPWAASLLAVAVTVTFYYRVQPWTGLQWEREARTAGGDEPAPEMPAPEDAAEITQAWGEVRITEPGRDLTVTKVDVVPLQIEAASSEELKETRYFTAGPSAPPSPHALPKPPEKNYAVYKPLLYVDEFRLADWDVLTYYAVADTTGGATYGSEVYFLEVRPFREDILKLPGGESGRAYQFLSELSGLIDRQKHVIRETHLLQRRPPERADQRRRDLDTLAAAEADLAETARHLYARIAARMENQNVGTVLDRLAVAEGELEAAARALAADDAKAADRERAALAALVATRKDLHKAVSEDPGALGDGDGAPGEDEPTAKLDGKLKDIAEFRDAEKAARELLERTVATQRRLADEAGKAPPKQRASLAAEQERIRRDLSEFASGNPTLFSRAEKERVAADESMRKSAEALADAKADGAGAARSAAAKAESLRDAVRRGAADQELTQAYQIRRMIDDQARALGRVEAAPEQAAAEDAARRGQEAKQATRELKRLMEDTPAGDAFGDPLHQALQPSRQAARERAFDALGQPGEPAARKRAAGEARRSLEQLGQAFDSSQPGTARALRQHDALGETGSEALARALRQLEGLAAEAEQGRERDGKDRERRRREILLALRKGGQELGRDADRVLVQVEDELTRADLKVDPRKLRQLLDQIEQFRVETTDRRLAREQGTRIRHLDPGRLPPQYRARIQKYFEKLSEHQ